MDKFATRDRDRRPGREPPRGCRDQGHRERYRLGRRQRRLRDQPRRRLLVDYRRGQLGSVRDVLRHGFAAGPASTSTPRSRPTSPATSPRAPGSARAGSTTRRRRPRSNDPGANLRGAVNLSSVVDDPPGSPVASSLSVVMYEALIGGILDGHLADLGDDLGLGRRLRPQGRRRRRRRQHDHLGRGRGSARRQHPAGHVAQRARGLAVGCHHGRPQPERRRLRRREHAVLRRRRRLELGHERQRLRRRHPHDLVLLHGRRGEHRVAEDRDRDDRLDAARPGRERPRQLPARLDHPDRELGPPQVPAAPRSRRSSSSTSAPATAPWTSLGVDTSDPYSATWATSAADPGTSRYPLHRHGRGRNANTTDLPSKIVDNTAPTGNVASPLFGSTVSGSITLGVSASDDNPTADARGPHGRRHQHPVAGPAAGRRLHRPGPGVLPPDHRGRPQPRRRHPL